MMKGYLKFIVMKNLLNKKLTGYDLIKQIHKDTKTWKPSFGSIYPLLEKLLIEKYTTVEKIGRKKFYTLTKLGKNNLEQINLTKESLADRMIAHWNVFGNIKDKNETGFMMEIMESMKQGKLPFSEYNPELAKFRAAIFEAKSKNKNPFKVKLILKGTIKELKQIK